MEEIWKDIKDYEGYYKISSYGRIKSLNRIVRNQNNSYIRNGKILALNKNKNNYYSVCLSKLGTKNQVYIHRLVAETFLKNPNNYKYVNHIDFNSYNNNIDNLEWCTQDYNVNYSYNSGRMFSPPPQIQKQIIRNDGIKYSSLQKAAEDINVNPSMICNQLKGRQKTIRGYTYKYIN